MTCWIGVVVRFALTITAAVVSLTMTLIEFESAHQNLIHGPLLAGVLVDLLIASSLSYYLFSLSRDGIRR